MRGNIPRLRLAGGPSERGHTHGQQRAKGITHYAADRVSLAASGSWAGRVITRADALDLAHRMLPAHRAYAPDLTAEMEALAVAAGISTEEALILGGFTDFVDAVRGGAGPWEDDCTAALIPAARAGEPWLVQTWDMHDSATDHVLLLELAPNDGPAARVFTTEGCLGQIGMNEHGITIGINNLTASDGRVGVTWPHVVRKALQARTLDAALQAVVTAPVAGGHAFLLLDAHGDGYEVEAMPTTTAVTRLTGDVLVHTNHALDGAVLRRQAVRPADLMASSVARRAQGLHLLTEGAIDVARLMAWTADPTLCRRPEAPHHLETSGAVIVRPRTGEMWCCWGRPDEAQWELA